MNKFLFSGILLILFCINTGLVMAQNPTAPALQFNIFLEKSARLSSNETEGPIALGENLTLDGNYQVAIKTAGNYMVNKTPIGLLVNGKIIYKSGNSLQVNNGYVKIGDSDKSKVWYKDKNGANSPIQITTGDYNSSPRIQLQSSADKLGVSASNNPVFEKELIDFGKAMETMRNSSLEISKSKQTAVLTDANGKPFDIKKYPDQVKIKLEDGVNYLNITGKDLNSVSVFTYENKPDENHVLVINIDAENTFNWKVWNQAGIGIDQCPYILYNFYNTETLKIEGNSTVEGTVFAPFANIFKKNNSANIEGQVIGLSFEQDAGEIHHAAFRPNLSNVVNCTNPVVDAITGAVSVCRSSSITLANTTSAGVWTSSNLAIATVNASGLVTGVAAGIATISYAVTNSCGTTTVTKDITVNIPPSVAAITGTATVCAGSNTTLSNTTVGGVWSSASTNIATVNVSGVVTGVAAGTSVVSYTVTASGCSTTATQTVTVNALPVVAAITGTATVCAGSNTTLSNTTLGGVWSSASTNIATVNASGVVTGVAAGTSVVSYTVTTNGCSTTATQTVTVSAAPVVAAITGSNNVCLGLTATLNNVTVGGVWSSNNPAVATVTNGIVIGESLGTASIIYTVTDAVCGTATSNLSITVQDCGSVSSGGTGGLESQSLGDAVAKRLYQSALNGTMQQPAYEFMKPFVASNIQKAITGTMASVPVNSLVPMQLTNTRLKSYLSTPTDIIGITNAKEVVSVDYTLNGSCKAVVFATTTKAAIYDHTKAVCDRLKGAQVVRMDSIILNGLGLLRFTLKYEDGHTENIISFSASTNPARNTIAIQSNWLKSAYLAEETMYNFQVWSVSDELSAEITGKILTQLQQVATIEPLKKSSLLPDTYFVSAKREGANLEMTVQNTLIGTSGYFELQEKANEQSTIVSRKIPFNFSRVQRNSIQLPVSDAFETTVKMFVNNQLQDEVFLSDGAWSVDYNPANTVLNKFEAKNDNRKTVPEELQLYRNVYASVNTNSYFTLLKLMRGGGLPKDISAYQTMKFNANGNGTLKITLVKQSVKNWDDQYFLKIPLSNNPKDYLIDLGDFSSLVNKNRIKPDDINAIVFTVTNSTGNSTNITQNINNLAFSKESISYIQSLSSKEIKVFPNPSTGKFNCVFQSDKDEQLQLSITDASKGIVLYRKTVSALRGSNTVSVDLGSTLQNLSVCVLTLVSEDGNYKPNRILIQPIK